MTEPRATAPIPAAGAPPDWNRLPDQLRARGLRWTPQRALLVGILAEADGHVTGSRLVDRCRELDPTTTPSTVYRTLDILEELGVISHSHGLDGREEFHVRPAADHGHLLCAACGAAEELPASEAEPFLEGLREDRGFDAWIGHLAITGLCKDCGRGA